ncbi:hypothetical protein [Lacrimispora saccharolytica]|nr:hypothetical protein [Lacrimispora saccharolytica]
MAVTMAIRVKAAEVGTAFWAVGMETAMVGAAVLKAEMAKAVT